MQWVYLAGAILAEAIGTTMLKLSNGFSRLLPSVLLVVFYAISFFCVSQAIKRLDISVAYAIWSAVGVALISAIGVLWFREPLSALKLGSLALIILGVIGLRVSGGGA